MATMLDPITRKLIWERFERDHPNPGPALADWCSQFAEESGVPEAAIRRVVTEGSAVILHAINNKAFTIAQELAERMGASLAASFEVLREAYHATKRKVLLDKAGRPKLVDPSETGPGFTPENMIYIDVPDWHARLSAVRTTIEIFGARAPQQFEVTSRSVNLTLSTKDAMVELQRLSNEIPKLQRAYAAIAEGDPDASGSGTEITGSVIN
jgi:hypothetical protein